MLKKIYSESFATIHAARYCILGVFLIYVGATALGWLFSDRFPFIKEQVRALTKSFADKSAAVFPLLSVAAVIEGRYHIIKEMKALIA